MKIGLLVAGVTALVLLGGCEALENLNPEGEGLLSMLNTKPTPAEVVKDAQDPYDADKRYRGTLLLATADFATEPLYLELFVQNLGDPDASVRAAACKALSRNGGPAHLPLLVKALGDPDAGVRVEAARAMQRIHGPEAVQPLIAAVREPNPGDPNYSVAEDLPELRAEAALALGQYQEPRVMQALIASLNDSRLAVNRNALVSLRTMTGQDFGFAPAPWVEWANSTRSPFAAASVYTFVPYHRPKTLLEYLPFMPKPPNEVASTPSGMPLGQQ